MLWDASRLQSPDSNAVCAPPLPARCGGEPLRMAVPDLGQIMHTRSYQVHCSRALWENPSRRGTRSISRLFLVSNQLSSS